MPVVASKMRLVEPTEAPLDRPVSTIWCQATVVMCRQNRHSES